MPPLDGDGDGWVICDLPLSPARPACDCQPTEPTIYPGASCFTGLPGVCSTGSYDCSSGPGSCSQNIFPTPEVCDGLDNNCDGAIDEGNPGGGAPCSTGLPGICDNGTTTCSGGSITCQQTTLPTSETCNGLDDNCNGSIDEGLGSTTCGLGVCAHVQQNCVGGVPQTCNPFQGASSEVCNDGLDNDCDGLADCADPDCTLDPACIAGVEDCGNGLDDDGDTLVDCADPDCTFSPLCMSIPEDCTNGLDDDGDTLVDCADPDCSADPACTAGSENCSDGADNDGDGLVDCADPDCQALSCGAGCICAYGYSQENNCADGIDNDGDGLMDCADPMCADTPACGGGVEVCGSFADADGDGLPGCTDGGCELHPLCITWDIPRPGPVFAVCNTGSSDPNCTSGRKSAVSGTCKPINSACYNP